MRHTYAIINRPDPQLCYFAEQAESLGTSNAPEARLPLTGTKSAVIFLETIPLFQKSDASLSWDVLVVHQDGTLRRFSGDLSVQRWTTQIASLLEDPESPMVLAAAHWMSAEQTKKSLLKNRPDLLIGDHHQQSTFLAFVAKKMNESGTEVLSMVYGLWHVTEQPSHNTARLGVNTVHKNPALLLHSLPATKKWRKDDSARYTFNSATGVLSIAHDNGLSSYDLTALTPQLLSKFSPRSGELNKKTSSLRLTPTLAVTATPNTLTLFDTKYQSIQSTIDLDYARSTRKRKRGGNVDSDPIELVTYLAKIKRIIGRRGHTLVSFDVGNVGPHGKYDALAGGSLLIDAIGRGMPSTGAQTTMAPGLAVLDFGTLIMPPHPSKEEWLPQQQQLDELAKTGDSARFEEMMAEELCDLLNPDDLSYQADIQLPSSMLHLDQNKVDYLLSKIFQPISRGEQVLNDSTGPADGLKIIFRLPTMIRWLISMGLLTRNRVEMALCSKMSKAARLNPGAVPLALTRDDPSHQMIVDYLEHSPQLTVSEILQTIKILLSQVIKTTQETQHFSPMRLENILGQDLDSESTVKLTMTVSHPPQDATPLDRSTTSLLMALEKFGSHSAHTITKEMRSCLGQPEVLSIIQVLRQQLFHSGHTSYLPTPPVSASGSPNLGATQRASSLSLESMLKLLSSCLDAFGALGFLAQSEGDGFLERLIPDLKSEISFAFEGMQETTHLQGLLREVVRFADSENDHNNYFADSPTNHTPQTVQKPGTVVTLYRESRADRGEVENTREILPLSLQADDAIRRDRVRKGGGQVQKRSIRDALRLQSRNVPKYSFERLVL